MRTCAIWLVLALSTNACSSGIRGSAADDLRSNPALTSPAADRAVASSETDNLQVLVPSAADSRPRASARAIMTGPQSAASLQIWVDPDCAAPGGSIQALVRSVAYADLAWGVEYPDGSNHGEYGITKAEAGGEVRWNIRLGKQAPEGPADLLVAASRTAERAGDPRYQQVARTSFRVDRSC